MLKLAMYSGNLIVSVHDHQFDHELIMQICKKPGEHFWCPGTRKEERGTPTTSVYKSNVEPRKVYIPSFKIVLGTTSRARLELNHILDEPLHALI